VRSLISPLNERRNLLPGMLVHRNGLRPSILEPLRTSRTCTAESLRSWPPETMRIDLNSTSGWFCWPLRSYTFKIETLSKSEGATVGPPLAALW